MNTAGFRSASSALLATLGVALMAPVAMPDFDGGSDEPLAKGVRAPGDPRRVVFNTRREWPLAQRRRGFRPRRW